MAESQLNISKGDLQAMLEAVVTKMKEPSEMEKAKLDKERAAFLRNELEVRELTLAQITKEEARRKGCPHFKSLNGQRKHGWVGQVNSDGLVRPVCKMCRTEWPPFTAKLLPDEGRQGVNFEEWNYCDTELLSNLHKQTYPEGCKVHRCWVCAKPEAKKA